MSTYLVCFAVHQFKHLERISAKGIPVSYNYVSLSMPSLYNMYWLKNEFCHNNTCTFCLPLPVQLRIYAQPSQLETAEYAANTTKVIFDFFEEYFNMTYSINKLGTFRQTLS